MAVVPTEHEMREAGVRLGLLAEGEPIPPRLRGKLARTVELAKEEAVAEQAAADLTTAVTTPVLDMWHALVDGGIPDDSAARIVAAVAPHIWRTNQPK